MGYIVIPQNWGKINKTIKFWWYRWWRKF